MILWLSKGCVDYSLNKPNRFLEYQMMNMTYMKVILQYFMEYTSPKQSPLRTKYHSYLFSENNNLNNNGRVTTRTCNLEREDTLVSKQQLAATNCFHLGDRYITPTFWKPTPALPKNLLVLGCILWILNLKSLKAGVWKFGNSCLWKSKVWDLLNKEWKENAK